MRDQSLSPYKIPVSAKFIFCIYILLIWVHMRALFDMDPTLGLVAPHDLIPVFFFILMPFWILFIFKANKLAKGANHQFIYKQIKNNLPPWIIRLVILTFIFAILNFIFAFAFSFDLSKKSDPLGLMGIRFFSAHFSLFFILVFAGLTGAANLCLKRCSNGHEIKFDGQYCPECGAKITS